MTPLPSLRALRAFESVSRLGGVRNASLELNVSQSAISHQIANLEEAIGVSLFERSGRSLVLTDTGRDYVQKIAVSLESLELATRDASRFAVRPSFTISAPTTFLYNWLLPHLDAYIKAEPHLDIRLCEMLSIEGNEGHIDRAIEYRLQPPVAGESQVLLIDDVVPLAAPSYVRQHSIKSMGDLLGATLIETERRTIGWKSIFEENSELERARVLSVSYSLQAFEAARLGYGVALGNRINAEPLLRSGALIVPFEMKKYLHPLNASYYLTKPSGKISRPFAEKFDTWLLSALRESLDCL